jgi:hypothetical protein
MRSRFAGGVAAGAVLACLLCASGAWAVTPSPGFTISSNAAPTIFSSAYNGSHTPDSYRVTVTNSGSEPTDGGAVTITDTLPVALVATAISGESESGESVATLQPMSCSLVTISCEYPFVLRPGESLLVRITVMVPAGITGMQTNTATVSGGGGSTVSTNQTTEIGSEAGSLAAPFGFSSFTQQVTGVNGLTDTQAGDHPYETTVSFMLNNRASGETDYIEGNEGFYLTAGGIGGNEAGAKDLVFDLPQGFLGNPDAIERCPRSDVQSVGESCPASTQIGVAKVYRKSDPLPVISPIFNVAPEAGFPAQFDFVSTIPIALYATVSPDTNYGVRITVSDIPVAGYFEGSTVTFFGTPLTDPNYLNKNTGLSSGTAPIAFLQDPVDCSTAPQNTTVSMDSWQHPGAYLPDRSPDLSDPNWVTATTTVFPSLEGCNLLQFNPSLSALPETTRADEPSGLTVDLGVPQASLVSPELGTPALKNVTVTFPAGFSLSPSAADGLQACSDAQIGIGSMTPGSCPDASVLGTVRVTTPLLAEPLEGRLFLGTPGCDPCTNADAADGNMFRLFIELQGSGVVIKLPGTTYVNTTTGQVTTTFLNNPQLPFSELQLQLKGGLRAPLATPQSCGTFTTTSDFTPWSTPVTPDATPSSPFNIDWDGNGGACPASMPFAPSFSAGTSNPNAGQFSPLTVTFNREDREQDMAGIQVTTPPGLSGILTGVPLCGEPQASLGTCSEASRIGTMTVAAGPGGHPFYERGSLYITGPYEGAPFGLSIVVPTIAGPFNLGNVVVRAKIDINPVTTALTVTSDPLPQILDGIPLRLRTANVTVERPGFIFNPTSCAQQHIEATITGARGAVSHTTVPFAVAGCAGLHFGPKFTVSTSGKTSKADGASLDARVVYPAGAQSNIRSVKVDLPKQLPSRLTTLQKACTAQTFEANPAACPAASLIGVAEASTPELPVALTGPVYFVSHGGEAFPSLEIILQGYGVRIDLTAATFISKAGITSSTFKTIPDAPVNSFELYLPEGPHSALAANGNLCTQKLLMPTLFTAQDGAQLKQSTKITVTGCPKVKAKKKTAKKKTKQKAKKASNARAGHQGGRS